MANEKNIQTVQQVYADFGNQNVEGVLNSFTYDVIWNDGNKPEIPYSKIRIGKEETLSFFMASLDLHETLFDGLMAREC